MNMTIAVPSRRGDSGESAKEWERAKEDEEKREIGGGRAM
jgi:hypothetical protein